MNEWGGEGREGGGQRTKEGNKESGENKGLRKEGRRKRREGEKEREALEPLILSNDRASQLVSAIDFLFYTATLSVTKTINKCHR